MMSKYMFVWQVTSNKHSKEQTHATHCRTTSINYYALEAQKLGPSEGFHKRLLTLNREEIDAGNMIKCCNPIAIRKNISQQNMCQRLDKNLFPEIWLVTEILRSEDIESKEIKGYVQHIACLQFALHMYTESQLQLYHVGEMINSD